MYKVFDLECDNLEIHKRKASPWHPDNYIVAQGWKNQGDEQCSYTYFKSKDEVQPLYIEDNVSLLVGFNIKFDLLWEMVSGNPSLEAFFKRGGMVWDCQYVEYLLQGQTPSSQMCSMDSIIETYGGKKKIDEVKAMWEAGYLTSAIPEDLLIDYLVGTHEENRHGGDIRNTELIFLGQVALAKQQDQIKMIQDRMDGLLCTTDMEFNGLKIDVNEARRKRALLDAELTEVNNELDAYVPKLPDGLHFNWGSRIHTSCLIFGGTIKYKKSAPYKDEDTGELVRYKPKAPMPLFNKRVVNPELFGYRWDDENKKWLCDAGKEHKGFQLKYKEVDDLLPERWTLYKLPHEEDVSGQTFEQDKFLGGKRKGEPKTKLMPAIGKIKTKIQDFTHKLEGYTEPDTSWETKTTDGAGNPTYSTSSDTIDVLGKRDIPFLKALGRKQTLDKELGTYYVKYDPKKKKYVGMLTCVDTETHIIHHKLNHTTTVTTRLSSSDPNLQNLTRADQQADGTYKSEVKRMFISRFGENGSMLEADYSQLEVVVQGVLSNDTQLCIDLNNRIDFHCKRVSASQGCTYDEALEWCKNEDNPKYGEWKIKRTKAKNFSFQRAYGAGATAIAESTGMSIEEVNDLIAAEEAMYPGVVEFNAEVQSTVERSAVPFQALDEDTGQWKTYSRGEWYSPTRTKYSWRSYNAPSFMKERGVETTFSPPELKNYPVQGTGGEFVQAVLGLLWRHFIANDNYGGKAFLCNTVHDCIWIDCHNDVLQQVAADIKPIMESIPEFFNSRHGMNIKVPFPVDVEAGQNMLELHGLH